jgi:ElaB/YqjD/DUF883 family membrane-anchored ribosome-binding protein
MIKNTIITCGNSLIKEKTEKSCVFCSDLDKELHYLSRDIEEILISEEVGDCKEQYNNVKTKLIQFFKKKYEEAKNKGDFSIFKQYCVEFKILLTLQEKKEITNEDKIFLFVSDTLIWKLIAEVIYEILKDDFNFYKIKNVKDNLKIEKWDFTIITWFQTDYVERFIKEAIPDLYRKLEKIKNQASNNNEKVMMYPVWWYRVLIPYVSIYAIAQGLDIEYIYGDYDEIVTLPDSIKEEILKNKQ